MSSEQRFNLDELATGTVAMPADTNPSGEVLVDGYYLKWILQDL